MPRINYNRLASRTAGTFITTTTLYVSLKLGSIPSMMASFVGLGGLVDFACGVAGVGGGIALYLQASKKLNTWPMDKDDQEAQNSFQHFFNPRNPDDETIYESYKAGLCKIEQELRSWSDPEQRQQLTNDFTKAKETLHAFLKSRDEESAQKSRTSDLLSLPQRAIEHGVPKSISSWI